MNIAKANSNFLPAGSLLVGAEHTFTSDSVKRLASGSLGDDEFLDTASELLGSINYLQPSGLSSKHSPRTDVDEAAALTGLRGTFDLPSYTGQQVARSGRIFACASAGTPTVKSAKQYASSEAGSPVAQVALDLEMP